MTTTAGRGGAERRHPDPDDEQPPTAAAACDDATVAVPPTTEAAPQLAWSHEEPVTEALSRPWRTVWAIAGLGVLCAVVAAVVIAVEGMGGEHRQPPGGRPATAQPVSASAPPSSARPPVHDDEYVATAISPRALSTRTLRAGGFGAGAGATQDEADRIALADCRSNPTYADNCLLVNTGMYHGCISLAVDASWSAWFVGTGRDVETADADAVRRLSGQGTVVSVQCSDPPGWLTAAPPAPSSQPAAPSAQSAPARAPAAPPPAAAAPKAAAADPGASGQLPARPDQVFRGLVLQIPGITVTNWGITEAGAHRVCGYLRAGHSHDDAVQQVLANDPTFTPWQASAMVHASTTAYCPP